MISKEAELFEKANIVDIGLQPNQFMPRRNSAGDRSHIPQSRDDQSNDNHNNNTHETSPPIEEELGGLSIDEVDNNIVVDEAYQRSLDERASQFMNNANSVNTNSFPPIPKPKIKYEYTDQFLLIDEIDQWFTHNEILKLKTYQKLYDSKFNANFYHLNFDEKEDIIRELISGNVSSKQQVANMECLLSIATGYYGQELEESEILKQINKNVTSMIQMDLLPWIVDVLVKNFEYASAKTSSSDGPSEIVFHCCTLLYFMILVCLEGDNDVGKVIVESQIDSTNLLEVLVKFIDQWRWNNRSSMRIRNIIMLLTKAFKFQIGDLKRRDDAKLYVEKKLNILRSNDDPNKLTASPIDFHTYRQELTTRYPSFVPPPSTLPENFEDTTSLTQFISIPKNQPPRYTSSTNPQPPAIHIATPAPSPSTSPVGNGNSKNMKGKRLSQPNILYPFIYPTEAGFDSVVPKSIQEATDLFVSRIRDKLHLIQLWDEFGHFVKQERGWINSLNDRDESFDYLDESDPEYSQQANSLKRIEKLYDNCLPFFSSLIHVLMEIINSAQSDIPIIKKGDFAKNDSIFNLLKAKNTILKESSYLLVLMLKWFKVNHVLKYEHLSCLIFDSNYYAVLIQYLKPFGDEILARVHDTAFHKSSKNQKIDDYFCFTLHNLLTVASKITSQKTQRVLDLCDKDATTVLRQVFTFENEDLWRPVLKLIKEIVPLKRKQWKAKNMDLISLVYLHGETSLRDNWLSGRDVDAEVNDRYGQEIALRALIQFYNVRKYNSSMDQLGYKSNHGSFFTREAEFLANEF